MSVVTTASLVIFTNYHIDTTRMFKNKKGIIENIFIYKHTLIISWFAYIKYECMDQTRLTLITKYLLLKILDINYIKHQRYLNFEV